MSDETEIPDYLLTDEGGDTSADVDASEYFAGSTNCFLCDHSFPDGETPWLMFEQRLADSGQVESSPAQIFSSALGISLILSAAHQSTQLCGNCNTLALEYEDLEKRFSLARYRILSTYNRTARKNNLKLVPFEIDGVLQNEEDGLESAEVATSVKTTKLKEEQFEVITLSGTAQAADEQGLYAITEITDFNGEDDLVEVVSEAEEDVGLANMEDPSKYAFAMVQTPQAPVSETVPEYVLEQDELSIESSQMSGNNNGNLAIGGATDAEFNHMEDNGSNSTTNNQVADIFSVLTSDTVGPKSEFPLEKHAIYDDHDGVFCCLICPADDAQEKTRMNIKRFGEHLFREHNIRFYICARCDAAGFLQQRDLNKHMDDMHSEIKDDDDETQLQCEHCDSSFANYQLLRLHRRLHTYKQYECTQCHKKYNSRNLLEEHMNMHTGVRPHECHICPKKFASKYTLQAHVKIHSERQRPFQCDECDKSFLKQQNLTQHKKLHNNQKPFVCEVCQKCFATQHNLRVHKIVHDEHRSFICRMCGKAFARRAEIRDHERTHTKEKPFACDMCDKSFAQRSNLTTHKKATHLNEKQHKCEYCERSFKRRRLMLYHINAVHTGERPYKCEICDASFVYPDHHKKHMLIHAAKKQYACEVCGKEFHSRDNRNAHRFVHSDKKPYECMECGAGFMRKPSLLSHMKQTKHVNDTIIVNQPQISRQDVATTVFDVDSEFLEYIDEDAAIEVIAGDAGLETLDIIAAQVKNENTVVQEVKPEQNGGNDIGSVSGQLIKDQIGNVKYIQFEDLDKDGQQTLTWVDIGDDKKGANIEF